MRPDRIFWHRTSRGGMMPPSSCSHTSFLLAPLNPIILFSSSLCLLANHQLRVLFSLDSFDQENRSAAAAGQCRPTRTAQNKKIGSLNVTMALRLVTSRVAASASSRSLAVAVRSTNGAFVWWKLSCVVFFFCTSRAQFPDLLSVMSSSSAFSSPSHHQFP